MSSNTTPLEERLYQWATDELRFSFDAGVTPLDLKELCRGQNRKIWVFLVTRVFHERRAELIRKNILLHVKKTGKVKSFISPHASSTGASPSDKGGGGVKEHLELRAKRERLRDQLAVQRSNIEKIRADISQQKTELGGAASALKAVETATFDADVSHVLLDTFAEHVVGESDVLKEYARRLSGVTTEARKEEREVGDGGRRDVTDVETSRTTGRRGGDGGDTSSSGASQSVRRGATRVPLDSQRTSAASHVRTTVDLLLSHLRATYDPVHTVKSSSNNGKQYGTTAMQNLPHIPSCNERAPVHFDAIIQLSQNELKTLRKAVDDVDLQKDALDLRRRFERAFEEDRSVMGSGGKRGGDGGGSSEQRVFDVESLLVKQRDEHIDRFVESQKDLNGADRVAQEVEVLLTGLKLRLGGEKGGNESSSGTPTVTGEEDGEDSMFQLQQTYVRVEAARAVLSVLDDIKYRLEGLRSEKRLEMQALKSKHERIQGLERDVQRKQASIRRLAGEGVKLRAKVHDKVVELEGFLAQHVVSFRRQLPPVARRLTSHVSRDVSSFNAVPLSALLLGANGRPVSRLSIHSLLGSNIPRSVSSNDTRQQHAIVTLTHMLSCYWTSYEQLLLKAQQMKDEAAHLDGCRALNVRSLEKMTTSMRELNAARSIEGLHHQLQRHGTTQSDKWLPSLNQNLQYVKAAVDQCPDIMALIEDWWNQPAQHIVPWINVDGKSMNDITTEWTELRLSLRGGRGGDAAR